MKNRFLVFLITYMAAAISSNAQEGPLAAGIKGGLNLSSLNVDDPQRSYDTRAGWHAGVFLRGRFDSFAVQPELLLSVQNGDLDDSFVGTAKDRFTYLAIPLLFKFYPAGGLNLHVGPQFSFLLDGKRKYETIIGNASLDITDEYKKSDIAISLGAGYDFDIGLNIDVRYNIGVMDISDSPDLDDARNNVIFIAVGWNFLQ